MSINYDNIYALLRTKVPPFEFNEEVVNVFADMIQRSVPGYSLTLPLIGLIAQRYAQPGSNCYDLGCSLGASTLAMRHHIQQLGCQIISIDNSPAMLTELQNILAQDSGTIPVHLQEADIREVTIENAAVVVLNFTLQFIDPEDRTVLVQRIYDGLRPGGVLILSEKVIFADEEQNERFITLHHDFKRANGYSDLEISQKRTAIENVLIPETVAQHQSRLHSAGFATSEVWFQALNFVSILAIK